MEISPEKSETISFLGKEPVRCKIVVDNKRSQQVRNFKSTGCEISCENRKGIPQKLGRFSQILGILTTLVKQIRSGNFQE
jgi:hypothetical protein